MPRGRCRLQAYFRLRAFANFLFLYNLINCFPSFVLPRISPSPQTPRRNIFLIRLLPESLRIRLQSLHVGKRFLISIEPPRAWAIIWPACHLAYSPALALFFNLLPHILHLPGIRFHNFSRRDLEICPRLFCLLTMGLFYNILTFCRMLECLLEWFG